MKEVFRHREFIIVSQYRSFLESEGITTLLRNEHLSNTEVLIPNFYPNLCVLNDEDYSRAKEAIRNFNTKMDTAINTELICEHCGERNPGNFEICYACNKPLPVNEDQ